MLRVSELKQWDVVDVSNGKNMGAIKDIEIDLSTGVVVGITVSNAESMFSIFSKNNELVIPWENIVKVGEDVVLVSTEKKNFSSDMDLHQERRTERKAAKRDFISNEKENQEE